MASSTRLAVALLTAAVSLVPMACGGDEAAMRATLTDDGCTYDGDTSPTAGVLTIEVENQTEFSGSFVLLSLAEGSTVDDLQAAIDQYPRQFERDGTLPEPPDYKWLVRSDVEAGATSALPANVDAGTYAVVCFVDDVPIEQVYIAEQLDVTSTGRPIRPPYTRPAVAAATQQIAGGSLARSTDRPEVARVVAATVDDPHDVVNLGRQRSAGSARRSCGRLTAPASIPT